MSPVDLGVTAGPFQGSIVALPTPFMDGGLDVRAVGRLVDFHANFGSDALLLGGTVGEGWSLSLDESAQLVARASETAADRSRFAMSVLFGVVEIDSRRAARMAEQAALAGADGIVIGAPPLVRADARGLSRHIEEILERLPDGLPVMLHNEPKRTGTDLPPEILIELAAGLPSLRAHCEGVGFAGRSRSLPARLAKAGLATLTSDDRMIGPFTRAGAVGAITTVANLVPGEVRALLASIRRDGPDADQRERALAPLIDMVRLKPGAPTIKTALAAMEAIGPELRPPLAQLSAADRAKVVGALETGRLLAPSQPA